MIYYHKTVKSQYIKNKKIGDLKPPI